MYELKIPFRLPGLNEMINAERRNKFIAAKMKHEYQDKISCEIHKQLNGVHISEPVTMFYYWMEPNKRRDPSNVCGYGRKLIEDALVSCGVLKDDGWNEIAGFSDFFCVDKSNPGVTISIIEQEENKKDVV